MLINQFYGFIIRGYISRGYISPEEFRNNIEWVGKSVISCVFNARGKVTALL